MPNAEPPLLLPQALAGDTLGELARALAGLPAHQSVDGLNRLIIALAGTQSPGAELRNVYLLIAAAALLAAYRVAQRRQRLAAATGQGRIIDV